MPITKLQNRDIIFSYMKKTRSYLFFSNFKFNEFDFQKKKKNKIERVFDRNPLQACQRH